MQRAERRDLECEERDDSAVSVLSWESEACGKEDSRVLGAMLVETQLCGDGNYALHIQGGEPAGCRHCATAQAPRSPGAQPPGA